MDRLKIRAAEVGLSLSAYLLAYAGEPYPEHGGAREQPTKKKSQRVSNRARRARPSKSSPLTD